MSSDHKSDVDKYIRGVTSGNIVTGRLERLAVWRHLADLEKQKNDPSYPFQFDEQIGSDAIEFSLCCNQFEGEWADKPLELRPEQKFIVWCVFGWRQKKDGLRRFRQGQIECARKWGKSTMIAYLACLLLFADVPVEPGAQGYVAATRKEQAEIVWNAAAQMIEKSPELLAEATIRKSTHEISIHDLNSKFYPLAQDGDKVDGFNPHFIIKDEEHAYRKYMTKFINTLGSGFGSRRQPLTLTITTFGDDTSDIWQSSHDYAVKVLESVITGVVIDDTWFVFIAAVDQGKDTPCFKCKGSACPWCGGVGTLPIDDPYDETCWPKANPGIGITPKWERMRETANEAKNRPDKEPEFLQKNLNIVVSAKSKVISAERWSASKGELSDWSGVTGHGGMDLARSDDFAAIAVVMPFHETDDSGDPFIRYECRTKTWTAQDRPQDLRLPMIARWVDSGHLFESPRDAVDLMAVEESVLEWHRQWSIRTWAYDKTYAPQLAQRIEAEGLEPFAFGQSHKFYTAPIVELLKCVGKFRKVNGVDVPLFKHDGNPCLAWQAGNLSVDKNTRGESMPVKSQNVNKIDAMVAILMALSECLYHQDQGLDGYYLKNSLALGGNQ